MSLTAVRTDANCVDVEWPVEALRRYGVPTGGPYDLSSFRIASALVGDPGVGIEVGFMGGEWTAESDLLVAIFGASREVLVDVEPQNSSLVSVRQGQKLSIGMAGAGHRSYLVCRPGRIDPASIDANTSIIDFRVRAAPLPSESGPFRVVTDQPEAAFFDAEYAASPRMNRLGIRLDARAELAHETENPSEPQCVGAIQITPDGTPILIGPDGPTLGGYPKVGAVASVDLDRLGQVRPGDALRFVPVGLDEARELARVREAMTETRCRELRAAVRAFL